MCGVKRLKLCTRQYTLTETNTNFKLRNDQNTTSLSDNTAPCVKIGSAPITNLSDGSFGEKNKSTGRTQQEAQLSLGWADYDAYIR